MLAIADVDKGGSAKSVSSGVLRVDAAWDTPHPTMDITLTMRLQS